MRSAAFLLALTTLVLAGCASPSPSAVETAAGPAVVPDPAPIDVEETVDLSLGGARAWSFDVSPGATSAAIHFAFAPLKGAPAAAGMPACFRWQTPTGSDSAGQCQGGTGNIMVSSNVVLGEKALYALDDVVPGRYTFSVEAQPGPVELRASVHVVQ